MLSATSRRINWTPPKSSVCTVDMATCAIVAADMSVIAVLVVEVFLDEAIAKHYSKLEERHHLVASLAAISSLII